MKYLLVIAFIFFISCSNSADDEHQINNPTTTVTPPLTKDVDTTFIAGLSPSENLDELKEMAKSIMNKFKFGIRLKIYADDPIKFKVHNLSGQAIAEFDYSRVFPDKKSDTRYYKNPVITINKWSDSNLKAGVAIVKGDYFLVISNIVHELCHYLQSSSQTKAFNPNWHFRKAADRQEYLKDNQREFEAQVVGGYYFLYYVKRSLLAQIMLRNEPIENKMKRIINASDKVLYPQELLTYPELSD